MQHATAIALAAGLTAGLTIGAGAQTFNYDEAVDGDLSTDINAPTQLGIAGQGESTVRFTMFDSASPNGDFDVFTFEIQDGEQLAAIILNDYIGIDSLSFIAIDDGDTFPVNPNTGDPSAFLGGALFGPVQQGIGGDLLDDLQLPFAGGTGFSDPVGPGLYTIFVQQTGPLTEVELGLVVVPAPASLGLLGLGGLIAARRRR